MINTEYIKMGGKVFEVVGIDGAGRKVCTLTGLKDIPEDKPLEKPEATEEKPKRTRTKKA